MFDETVVSLSNMPATIPAMVNPALLVWAREEAGFSQEGASQRIKRSIDTLRGWEEGKTQPTLRQAEALAKLYDRSFSVFSLPAPPQLPPLAAEYRRLPGVRAGSEPPELRAAVRRLIQRRRIALHLYAELGDEPVDFPLRAHLKEDPQLVGEAMREGLGIPISTQLGWESEFVAYRAWRETVERLGVLVCQFPGKGIAEVRGTSILHFPLPVVGISSKELPLSKPFTLLHELAHVALASSREESPALTELGLEADWLKVEQFCETVAGAALMPSSAFAQDPDVVQQRRNETWTVEAVRRTARRFRVTPTAAATRSLRLELMSPRVYYKWKDAWEAYQGSHPDRSGFGIATPAEKAIGRNGPLLTSLVLSALSSDRISSADAANFLEVGFGHVETLRKGWIEGPSDAIAG
jgi:Zn-dependent peptidase ImmA (M78 family)/transcriptional regulator with XRE-family HTH domain